MRTTKKVYREVAGVLAGEMAMAEWAHDGSTVATLHNLTLSLADVFKRADANFDRERFYADCTLKGVAA